MCNFVAKIVTINNVSSTKMKRKLLIISAIFLGVLTSQAQTILEEDFETGATVSQSSPLTRGTGWTTVNSYKGENYRYNWFNEYRDPTSQSGPVISGAGCAACDAPVNVNVVDGSGPREEILLSPELNLDNTYELQFTWMVSPMNCQDNSRYDLQVRVVENDNLAGAETVFSIQDKNMLKESGVTVFPINTWDRHVSKVDLSDWKGKKVKLAFVYKMFTTSANIAWLDDISVKQFTPPTGPVATVNLDRYNFGNMYIGEKLYTEVITMTNTGKNGLKITGIDKPENVGINIDTESVNLDKNDQVRFQLSYTATLTSPSLADVTIHTTGGDVKIALSANKQFLPDGYLIETFNDYFPPAGWKNNGWSWANAAIEGDHSAYCGGGYSKATLRSPRLDLTNGGKLVFTYFNQYEGESVPDLDVSVEVSTDGGDNWNEVWKSEYDEAHLNKLLTAEVTLPTGSDECYVRFVYPVAVSGEEDEVPELSNFTLDRVLLPNVYGMNDAPGKATLLTPTSGAANIYPKNIKLEWGPAQFATGYKVFVGSNSEVNNLVDGANVNNALSIVIPEAAYETTYKWKIVAYNDKGETASNTFSFTTQPDASVLEFPWEENFDKCNKDMPVPTGWLSTTTGSYPTFQPWSPNNIYPYGGKGVSLATGWKNKGESSILVSPEFVLPAEGQNMNISFDWGDAHPSDLLIDETGLLKKQNVPGGNGVSDIVFEIGVNGNWTQASYISENTIEGTDGKKYWRHETIDLTAYAGKRVQFRWVNTTYGNSTGEAALDNIVINGIVGDYVIFNKDGWDAGQVNYNKGAKSADITMLNRGKNAQKVKSVTFGTNSSQSSIAAGTEIPVEGGISFNVTFTAKEAAKEVQDVMTVEFESGLKAEFPVKGEGLAEDVIFYGFEKNSLDYEWTADFTTIDVDKKVTYQSNYYLTEIENDGGRYAFTQAVHNNPNLAAHSGIGTIVATAPDDNSAADDWLISRPLKIGQGATFDFYARNLGTQNSVFVGDNDLHTVTVLVSEESNTKTTDFKVVLPAREMEYLPENQWHHFTADLSAFAGKDVYVAVRHTTGTANWMAFFDDFTFTHVTPGQTPNAIDNMMTADSEVTVYSVNGVLVAKGRAVQAMQNLGKGMYVVKTANGKTVKTIRR